MIRNSYKTLMAVLATAVVTFAIPASAHAAVHSVKPAAPAGCLDVVLVDKGDGLEASLTSSGVLDFVGASQRVGFCLAEVGNTGLDAIYTATAGDCLAWSSTAQDVYQHNPNGCGSNTSYLEWFVLAVGSNSNGTTYYILQNQYSDVCFYSYGGSNPVYGACNTGSQADEYYFESP